MSRIIYRLFLGRWKIGAFEREYIDCDAEDDDEPPEMGGGSAHNFERDLTPINADGEEP